MAAHASTSDLAQWVHGLAKDKGRPTILGVSGAQGSGKSTLCRMLGEELKCRYGWDVATISIDDLYRTRAERQELARSVHPLCAIRGLPGTHDVALGHALLDALGTATASTTTRIPRFDKATDDRVPEHAFDTVKGRPDLVLFEGWCVGAPPAPAWTGPINPREARDDPDGVWMRWSERQLVHDYLDLWARLDALLMIEVASFEAVVEGRWRQEQGLAARAGTDAVGVMSREEVEAYVALFERKTRQLLRELPSIADRVVPAWTPKAAP
ncbi:MAG: kinase [Proteobacteria bacterium]|nr:kinase [Pseudomonadota bacterium]